MGLWDLWKPQRPRAVLLPDEERVAAAMRREMHHAAARLLEAVRHELRAQDPAALERVLQGELEALRKELRQEGRARVKQTAAAEGALDLARQAMARQSETLRGAAELERALEERLLDGWLDELLSALDGLDAGIDRLGSAAGAGLGDYAVGFEMARGRLLGLLRRQGVEPMDVRPGQSFDPALQRALGARVEPGARAGSVLELLRRGYRRGERILRYAEVVVAREAPADGEQETEA
jgi:molecular chaperone GrpE